MIVVTTNEVPGHDIVDVFGEVMGLTVRARDMGANWTAGWRSMGGGEIPEFTRLLAEARMQVMGRMVDDALGLGANAVVAMRFDSSEIGNAWTEVCAYGTAVRITRPDGRPVAVQAARAFPGSAYTGGVPPQGPLPAYAPVPPQGGIPQYGSQPGVPPVPGGYQPGQALPPNG
ncbi:YbjQ family protein [Pseudoclavibacter chungangensis]|uniref:UPF0145 protein F8O01_16990 n=1 Tax=Pseudoclavibacter chungangensis TaxID=587635 RepID=A0A7J5BM46_9MICO|nr:YbjQ family protein [Pseudoclavibacter chungangensis]KAB1652217.1 YbjQ family protein [Pseudoclavibacter chungangensis]NYJ67593.1 uncharacterized protein YbjQ (UPF0145 family) [Pseudoclavibacter chungangensis]